MPSFLKHISIYVPSIIVSNEDIAEKFPDWDSEKIFSKIGIKNRNIAKPEETIVDMAVEAIKNLVDETSLDLSTVDYLILCTQSPDFKLPTSACIVQDRVGLSKNCAAIDINQGCSGYIYGLSIADALVSSGNYKNVLLITSEAYSKIIHKEDRGNISLFGDGATASLISQDGEYRIGKFNLGTDGSGFENLIVRNGGSKFAFDSNLENLDNYLFMEGSAIFDFTSKNIPSLVAENLEYNNILKENIEQFIFHQANTFMLSFLRKRINISTDKFLLNMENYGNTVSSSIPLAFKDYFYKGFNSVMLVGFGVGYSWGAVTLFKN
jgi:3-oxoacyl-[acyl-carrier-protein] synthase-3